MSMFSLLHYQQFCFPRNRGRICTSDTPLGVSNRRMKTLIFESYLSLIPSGGQHPFDSMTGKN